MKKGGGIGTSKPKKESPKTESPKTKKKRKNVSFPDDPVTQIHNLSPQEKLEFHKKNKTNIHEPKTRKEKLAAKRVRQKILVDLENRKYEEERRQYLIDFANGKVKGGKTRKKRKKRKKQ
tara:strand:- start:146 stop:505 length:360 start_codon:yes stop_codon:yes gene_type:complete